MVVGVGVGVVVGVMDGWGQSCPTLIGRKSQQAYFVCVGMGMGVVVGEYDGDVCVGVVCVGLCVGVVCVGVVGEMGGRINLSMDGCW